MKIKKLMYVLMGTILVFSSCSDNELENGGKGPEQPVASSPLVNVYADESCSEASLLAGDILLNSSKTMTLNVPIHTDVVYMRYNKASGGVGTKAIAVSALTRAGEGQGAFDYEMSRKANVSLTLPEDAVKPTDETDAGYLFYHNTGVAMFEDSWPKESTGWDKDFNDVVFEYDLKVTECQDPEQMAKYGSKEELLLTLDVRAVGGTLPNVLGVVLEDLDSKYVDRITASLVLKGGQGTMRDLGKKELQTNSPVVVNVPEWNWDNDPATAKKRNAILTVDKGQTEGTVITLDGLSSLYDSNQTFFQTTWGSIRVGLPMLRAEIRLIGSETGVDIDKQREAYRELILDTKRQNFFIKISGGKEIHMKGYESTSAYASKYAEDAKVSDAKEGEEMDANIPYCNQNGFVWGMKVPVGIRHAYEKVAFDEAYPKFANWVKTNGKEDTDWYLNPNPLNNDEVKETAYLVRYW